MTTDDRLVPASDPEAALESLYPVGDRSERRQGLVKLSNVAHPPTPPVGRDADISPRPSLRLPGDLFDLLLVVFQEIER